MLTGCASAPPVPQREVSIILNSNYQGFEVTAQRQNGRLISLGKLPFNIYVSLPKEPLVISVSYNSARYEVSPSSSFKIDSTESFLVESLTFTEVLPTLRNDFNAYPLNVRRNLIGTINAFDIALKSPKFMFSSKVSEAKAKLDDLYVQYPEFQDTKFFEYMKLMYSKFQYSAFLGVDLDASTYLRVVKEATGQLN
jgi:hypothetical protein